MTLKICKNKIASLDTNIIHREKNIIFELSRASIDIAASPTSFFLAYSVMFVKCTLCLIFKKPKMRWLNNTNGYEFLPNKFNAYAKI